MYDYPKAGMEPPLKHDGKDVFAELKVEFEKTKAETKNLQSKAASSSGEGLPSSGAEDGGLALHACMGRLVWTSAI